MRHVEGAPFGTRGGTAVMHHFPADGEYTFQPELYYYYLGELIGGNLPESLQGQELEISIDGERVARFTIDPLLEGNTGTLVTPPIKIKAGPHRLAAAFVAKADGAGGGSVRLVEQTLMDVSVGMHPGMTTLPHLQTLTVVGPTNGAGVSDTPSRKQILRASRPTPARKRRAPRRIINTLARAAFRRPLDGEDVENADGHVQGRPRGRLVRSRHPHGGAGIIARPEFIFRFERVPDDRRAPGRTIASAISNWRRGCRFSCGAAGPDEAADRRWRARAS